MLDEKPVWWCPQLKAVLANEEVVDGKSEAGNHPVELETYARSFCVLHTPRVLAGLDDLDWPDSTKRQQKAWIGRSEGAEMKFAIDGSNEKLEVYTTRPDTLFGATYMVVAPEHLARQARDRREEGKVKAYVEAAAKKSDFDRTDLLRQIEAFIVDVSTLNEEKIPVWVADYVLINYGTGAMWPFPGMTNGTLNSLKSSTYRSTA